MNMAKKKNTKNKVKQTTSLIDEKVLPQNIRPFGEQVEENKNIYILQKTYKDIHKFTQNKTTNESGGMLIGYVIEEFGKTNIVINGFVEAKHCEATPTTLKFTHETWDYVHLEMDKKYPGGKIVGWIHTHPDFGIFLSEYDKFIHENFFNEEYQIAYVVDPIQNIEGFYFWINGKIERCKGFYVYDKTGVKINIDSDKEQADNEHIKNDSLFSFKNILIGIMALLIVFLLFSNMSQNGEINKLQKQQETLAESANQSLAIMQQQINSLSSQIYNLEQSLKSAEDDEEVDASKGDQETENKEDANTNGQQTDGTGTTPETTPNSTTSEDESGNSSEKTKSEKGVNNGE